MIICHFLQADTMHGTSKSVMYINVLIKYSVNNVISITIMSNH